MVFGRRSGRSFSSYMRASLLAAAALPVLVCSGAAAAGTGTQDAPPDTGVPAANAQTPQPPVTPDQQQESTAPPPTAAPGAPNAGESIVITGYRGRLQSSTK